MGCMIHNSFNVEAHVFLLRSGMSHVCVNGRRTSHSLGISSNVNTASANVHRQAASTTQNTKSNFKVITVYANVHTRAAQNTMDTGSDFYIITGSDEIHLTSALTLKVIST